MTKVYGMGAALALACVAGTVNAQCNNFTMSSGAATVPAGVNDVGNYGDDVTTGITLPFTVTLYGQGYTTATVSSNGTLQFATVSAAYTNGCLPSATFNGPTVLAHWDDQRTDAVGSGIFTNVSGAPGSQVFDIEWRTTYYNGAGALNYAVRLYEGLPRIDIIMGDNVNNGNGATIGVQSGAALGNYADSLICNGAGTPPASGTYYRFECNVAVPGGTIATVGGAGNGATVLATVTAIGAQNPPSTGMSAVLDASAAGGPANLTMFDNGTHGDVTAGDNVFSNFLTLGTGYSDGQSLALTATVTDAQNRSGPVQGSVRIDDNLPAIATLADGPAGALTTLSGTLGTDDADMYRIHLCDPANFSATTVGGTTVDTQLFLFKADGTGIVTDDDHVGGATLQSALSNAFTASLPAGDYYLAVSQFDKDPRDNGGNQLWLDLVGGSYRVEHAPDDAGAANAIAGWDTIVGVGGPYTIALTGVNGTSCGPVCGTSDFNGDGDFGTDQDIEAFFACLAGVCCQTCFPGGSDFNGDGDYGTDQDIEAFFRVLAGNPC